MVERNAKKEREIERGRRESVERKDEEKKRGSIVVERELSGLPGFINVCMTNPQQTLSSMVKN